MLDERTRIEVMERCSCDFEVRKREARRIYEESRDIDDFIVKLGNMCNKLCRFAVHLDDEIQCGRQTDS